MARQLTHKAQLLSGGFWKKRIILDSRMKFIYREKINKQAFKLYKKPVTKTIVAC